MSTRAGWARRTAGVLACFVTGLVALAAPAAAHDELTGTDPADGATVDVAPDRVVLTFSAPALELGTEVQVTGPDGAAVAEGPVELAGTTVAQPLSATRPAGAYRVDWRVTSQDGHPVTGTFTFTATAGTAPEPTPSATPSATSAPSPSSAAPAVDPQPVGTPQAPPTAVIVAPAPSPSAEAGVAPADRDGTGGGLPAAVWVVLVAAVLAALAGGVAALRRRSRDIG